VNRLTSAIAALALAGLFSSVWMAAPVVASGAHTNSSIHGTVTFWNAYNASPPTPNENSVLTGTVIPRFEKLYPKVKVDAVNYPYNGLEQKVFAQMPLGSGPDVLRSDIIWVPQLAKAGVLDALDKFSWFKTYAKTVFPGTLKTNYYKGHYYGISLDTNTRVLISNDVVLKQAGIKAPPTTIKQFLADCNKIKALGGGHYCYAEGGTGSWNVNPWIWSFGGAITNNSFTKSTGYLNDSKSVAAIQMLVNLLKDGEMTPTILGSGIGTSDCLGKNVCGFIVDGPWMKPIFAGIYPKLAYKFSLMPGVGHTGVSVTGGEDIVINKFSHNQAASQAFVKFMLSKWAQKQMGNIGQMSVLKSLAGCKCQPGYFKTFADQLLHARPRTPSPNEAQIDNAISNAVAASLRNQGTVKSNLTTAAGLIDGYVK
jgi:multiple sugar transport system substrate-binding protein